MINITKEQIAEVRKLAYADIEVRNVAIAAGTMPASHAGGYAKVGCLSLALEMVNTKGRFNKALRDTYRVNGKIVAKKDILAILPE